MIFNIFMSFDSFMKFFNVFCMSFIFLCILSSKNNLNSETKKNMKFFFAKKEIKINSKLKELININIIFCLFLLISFLNLLGMIPYFFTLSSLFNTCLMLSMSFWLMILLNNMKFNFKKLISHLVPYGCPTNLSQFMVLIELISNIIRPMTLSIRLMANLTAGHLIMILCSSPFILFSSISLPLSLLVLLEMMVTLIQAYVFMTLISMYMGEN